MSENFDRMPSGSVPKTERWLIIMAWSFAPAVAALFAPQAARLPLFAVGGLLFVYGFVLMVRQSRASRGDGPARGAGRPAPEATEG